MLVGCSSNTPVKNGDKSPSEDQNNEQSTQEETSEDTEFTDTDMISLNETNEFEGSIGTAKIHMTLNNDHNQLSGSYYYDKYEADITLTGTFDMEDHPKINLNEDTEQEGVFVGILRSSDSIEGYWKDSENIYPMYLTRIDSDAKAPKEPAGDIMKLDGPWFGKNATYFNGTDLYIHVLFDDLVYFQLDAYKGANLGILDGLAVYEDGKATINYPDEVLQEDTGSKDSVYFSFTRSDNELLLDSNNYTYGCGAGVSFDDTYTQDEAETPMPTALDVGIVSTKEQATLFENMVQYKLSSFIASTEDVMYEETTLDGKSALAGESYLPGASGTCYYINKDGYLYAAISENDTIDYFTNDSAYANSMPQPMAEWASALSADITFNEVDAPYPFDSSIEDQLKSQIAQIKAGKKIVLPTNYALIDSSVGDLDQNGYDDIAVVIEQGDGSYSGSRRIYIYLNKDGSYELSQVNTSLILGRKEGGVLGDPYDSISISEGKLHVNFYGGSSYRWSLDYSFQYQDGALVLTQIGELNFSVNTLDGTMDIYNLMNKTMESRNIVINGDTGEVSEKSELTYSGQIKDLNQIAFSDTYAWCQNDFELEP